MNWWTWMILAAGAVLVFVICPLCGWLDERDARRDREAWSRMPGARR